MSTKKRPDLSRFAMQPDEVQIERTDLPQINRRADLLSPDEVDAQIRDHVESTEYVDPSTGQRYDPRVAPTVDDGDADD